EMTGRSLAAGWIACGDAGPSGGQVMSRAAHPLVARVDAGGCDGHAALCDGRQRWRQVPRDNVRWVTVRAVAQNFGRRSHAGAESHLGYQDALLFLLALGRLTALKIECRLRWWLRRLWLELPADDGDVVLGGVAEGFHLALCSLPCSANAR